MFSICVQVYCPNTKDALAVDVVNADAVRLVAGREGLKIKKVLSTHHHTADGNRQMKELFGWDLEVYGGDERVRELTHRVQHNEKFDFCDLNILCLATPCHTAGHVCYYMRTKSNESFVFTGDTLLHGGCGRFLEGTADEMYTALYAVLGTLPGSTLVFCSHEYTLNNLFFAQHVEPNNLYVQNRLRWAKAHRITGRPTVPTTIEGEKLWNPFMRSNEETLKNHTGCTNPIHVLKALREEKDNYVYI